MIGSYYGYKFEVQAQRYKCRKVNNQSLYIFLSKIPPTLLL